MLFSTSHDAVGARRWNVERIVAGALCHPRHEGGLLIIGGLRRALFRFFALNFDFARGKIGRNSRTTRGLDLLPRPWRAGFASAADTTHIRLASLPIT